MKTYLYISLVFFINSFNSFSQISYIQVVAEPGLSIFLDEQFKGKTASDVGGLIIEKLNAGNYTIKVVKEGFIPQEESINVKSGEVLTYKVKPFVPAIKISEKGNEENQQINLKTGNLKIQSLPVGITIQIKSIGISRLKAQDEWTAESIPEGTYDATFTWNNKTLNYSIVIYQNQLTHLFVNMLKEEIEKRAQKNLNGNDNIEHEITNNISENSKEVFIVVEKMPEFPGGLDALRKFISDNINYPAVAKENNIQGKVLLKCVITDDGSVEQVSIVRKVDPLLDEEAIRIVKTLPKFKPGMQKGKPVNVWYALPVVFQLQGNQ